MKPNKPATEMTEEEIHAFAEEMYNRIIGTLPERKVDDKKYIIQSKKWLRKKFLVPTK